MCACTLTRSSVIIFCEDFERSCVREYDVKACTTVAANTPNTRGARRFVWRLRMTSSIKYFDEKGSTNPETRLIAIKTNPRARIPRLGLRSAQTSGSIFHAGCFAGVFGLAAVVRPNPSALLASLPERPDAKDLMLTGQFVHDLMIIAEPAFERDVRPQGQTRKWRSIE